LTNFVRKIKTLQEVLPDLISGILVFLIALPLCLGISIASGFPPVAGIYTAIIGGLVVSLFKSAHLTIKGPAAGLIVVAYGAVEELGRGDLAAGYPYALACIVLAGVLQVIFGLTKAGIVGDLFPSSVVHGMLSSIGIIILVRQFFPMLGYFPKAENFWGLIIEIPHAIRNTHPLAGFIGLFALFLLLVLSPLKNKYIKQIPAPIMAIVPAIFLSEFFQLGSRQPISIGEWTIYGGPEFLVRVPDNINNGIKFPDFSMIYSLSSLKYILMFAMIGSLETLICTKAVDMMDPWKRKSNLSRDLTGVGTGNILSGMIGGLPMISEIVRSSSNISYGGRTWRSNFFHGLFLLIFLGFFPNLIKKIPLSALGGLLVFTGFKLANPKQLYHTWKVGHDQLIVYLSTIILTLSTDLLIGIGGGLLIKIIIHFMNGLSPKDIFKPYISIYRDTEKNRYWIDVGRSAVFTNLIAMKRTLKAIPSGAELILDFSNCKLLDHAVIQNLEEFRYEYEAQGGVCKIDGLDTMEGISAHPQATRRRKKEVRKRKN